MKKPMISICIPTYNREKYLNTAISSVIDQVNKNYKDLLEMCISDNCSTDGTERLVKKWIKKSPIPIFYKKNKKNLGLDQNFLNVADMTHGEYCWFLSSDDAFESDAINVAIRKIKENPEIDLFVLNDNAYDTTLKKKMTSPPFKKFREGNYCFENPLEVIKKATSRIGYVSILIFKKKIWIKEKGYKEFIGSVYVHVYILFCAIKRGAKVMFNSDPVVKHRLGNDLAEMSLNVYKRRELDIKGFYDISAKVFGEYSKEQKVIINALFSTIINRFMIAGIKLKRDRELTKKMYSMLFKYYKRFPKFWITVVPFMLVPTFAYEFAAKTFYKKLYQKF